MSRHAAQMRENRNANRNFMGKSESERPVGRPRRRLLDNIKMDLRAIVLGGID
jgi:hypothetical protein